MKSIFDRYLGQDEDVQMREKFEEMDLDMDEVLERIEKANGKLKNLESNHDMIKKKLAKMATIITGKSFPYTHSFSLELYCRL